MTWRGVPLNKITYNICAEHSQIRSTALVVEDKVKAMGQEEYGPVKYSYDWRLLSKYITGIKNVEPNWELENYSKLYLDFATHIGGHRNFDQLKVPIFRLAFRSCFVLLREFFRSSKLLRVIIKVKRLVFKNAG